MNGNIHDDDEPAEVRAAREQYERDFAASMRCSTPASVGVYMKSKERWERLKKAQAKQVVK